MVEMALERLSKNKVVELDKERKAGDGREPPRRAVRRAFTQPVVKPEPSISDNGECSVERERKAFLLRIDPALHTSAERWAADELRSLNAQVNCPSPGRSRNPAE